MTAAMPAPVPDDTAALSERFPADAPGREAAGRVWRIRKGLFSIQQTLALIKQAYDSEDWKALGYPDWQAYVAGEFGEGALSIPKARREEIVSELADSMSTRAIASVLGVSKDTVHRALPAGEDQRAVSNETPGPAAPVGKKRGLDGKKYPSKKSKATQSNAKQQQGGAAQANLDKAKWRQQPTEAERHALEAAGLGVHMSTLAELLPGDNATINGVTVHRDLETKALVIEDGIASANQGSDGQGAGLMTTIRTLTAFDVRAHAALHAQDEEFRSLIESLRDWVTEVETVLGEVVPS